MFISDKNYGEDYDLVIEMCRPKAGDVFVDIGANLGQEIEFFSKFGMMIDSYEPHPYFFKKINDMFGHLNNVNVTNSAVWSKNEIRSFYFKKPESQWGENHRSGGASLCLEKSNILRQHNTEVSCIDVAEIVRNHDSIKILKIDAEGAEYDILYRLVEESLIFKPEFIFFEDHERKMSTSKAFMEKKRRFRDFATKNGLSLYSW